MPQPLIIGNVCDLCKRPFMPGEMINELDITTGRENKKVKMCFRCTVINMLMNLSQMVQMLIEKSGPAKGTAGNAEPGK